MHSSQVGAAETEKEEKARMATNVAADNFMVEVDKVVLGKKSSVNCKFISLISWGQYNESGIWRLSISLLNKHARSGNQWCIIFRKPKNAHMWHFLSCNLLFLCCQNLSTTWTVEHIGNWNKISHNLQEICSSHHVKWNWLLSGHEQFRGKIVNKPINCWVWSRR